MTEETKLLQLEVSGLRPCPACQTPIALATSRDNGPWAVWCRVCKMRGPTATEFDRACLAWNTLPR